MHDYNNIDTGNLDSLTRLEEQYFSYYSTLYIRGRRKGPKVAGPIVQYYEVLTCYRRNAHDVMPEKTRFIFYFLTSKENMDEKE